MEFPSKGHSNHLGHGLGGQQHPDIALKILWAEKLRRGCIRPLQNGVLTHSTARSILLSFAQTTNPLRVLIFALVFRRLQRLIRSYEITDSARQSHVYLVVTAAA